MHNKQVLIDYLTEWVLAYGDGWVNSSKSYPLSKKIGAYETTYGYTGSWVHLTGINNGPYNYELRINDKGLALLKENNT